MSTSAANNFSLPCSSLTASGLAVSFSCRMLAVGTACFLAYFALSSVSTTCVSGSVVAYDGTDSDVTELSPSSEGTRFGISGSLSASESTASPYVSCCGELLRSCIW